MRGMGGRCAVSVEGWLTAMIHAYWHVVIFALHCWAHKRWLTIVVMILFYHDSIEDSCTVAILQWYDGVHGGDAREGPDFARLNL